MRQPNGVSAPPRDKLKFRNPIELGHCLIAFLPVAVQTNHLRVLIVNHQNVRCALSLRVLVVIKFQVGVNVINPTNPVLVVTRALALNLVGGLLRPRLLRLNTGFDEIYVPIQPRTHAILEFIVRKVVNFGNSLSRIEISCRKRDQDVVNRQKLSTRALLLLVVPEF